MNLPRYLHRLHRSQIALAGAFDKAATVHRDEPDVEHACRRFGSQCGQHAALLQPFMARYAGPADDEPDGLHTERITGVRTGGLGLLRDLHDLYLMAADCDISWTIIGQAAKGARDDDLVSTAAQCEGATATQMNWLTTLIKQAAPQTLIVV